MVETDDLTGVDENVAAQLPHVVGGPLQLATAEKQFGVRPPRRGAKNLPPTAAMHAVRFVQLPGSIDNQRPGQLGRDNVVPRDGVQFKSDDQHLNVQ